MTRNQGIDELINTEEGKIVDIWPLILFSCPNLRYWGEQTFTEELGWIGGWLKAFKTGDSLRRVKGVGQGAQASVGM